MLARKVKGELMSKKLNVKFLSYVLPCVLMCSGELRAAETKSATAPSGTTGATGAALPAKAKEMSKEELFSAKNIAKLSETYGHLIQKGLDNPVLKLDFDAVIKGMQDGKAGKKAPMTEQEYEVAINQLQEVAYQDLSTRNLQEAEKFLKENAKKEGVIEVEPGKLQYIVLKAGNGDAVTEETRPMIKYSGQYLDGTVFGSSESTNGPIAISLKQTIPGFRKGVLGMKVGEKRRLFIHPEMGYGTSGQLLPNALLIFEIEVTELKPEPKEPAKVGKDEDGDDDSEYAAENLFPDELDERDDVDGDDDDDEADEEDESADTVASLDAKIQPEQKDARTASSSSKEKAQSAGKTGTTQDKDASKKQVSDTKAKK
jgi:peptidylprolyl isomerase